MYKKILLLAVSLFLFSCSKEEKNNTPNSFEIAVLIDLGSVDDKSFNQGSW